MIVFYSVLHRWRWSNFLHLYLEFVWIPAPCAHDASPQPSLFLILLLVVLLLFLCACRAGGGRAGFRRLVLLLPLHPSVLEPDFDLTFGEADSVRYLDAPPPGEVSVKVELFLQLQRLVTGVRLPAPLSVSTCQKSSTHTEKTGLLHLQNVGYTIVLHRLANRTMMTSVTSIGVGMQGPSAY